MLPSNAYDVKMHLDAGEPSLTRLAALDSARPIAAPALAAYAGGSAIAALSLRDGRTIADPFRLSGAPLNVLRLRAASLHAADAKPSLRERLLAALPMRRRAAAA